MWELRQVVIRCFWILRATKTFSNNFYDRYLHRQSQAGFDRDRIVLVGMTAASVNDTLTSAVKGTLTAALAIKSPWLSMLIYGGNWGPRYQPDRQRGSQRATAAAQVRGLGICLWFCLGSRGIALGLILQSPGKRSEHCSQFWGICRAADMLEWVPVVPALLALRCRTDDLIFWPGIENVTGAA